MAKIYTAEEIVRHNHNKNLWIVIHGNVYDLTKFYKEHPGGEEVLLELAGKDGSKCFDSIGHSDEAIMLRNTFKIGEIQGANLKELVFEVKSESEKSEMTQDENRRSEKQEEQKKSFLPLVAIALVIYAFIIYYIWF